MYAIMQSDSQQRNEQYLKTRNDNDAQRYRRVQFGIDNSKCGNNSDEDLLAVVGVRESGRETIVIECSLVESVIEENSCF